jgi:hypothetical protein
VNPTHHHKDIELMKHTIRRVALGALAVTLLLACSDEQKRDIEGGAVKSQIEDTTKEALKQRDIVVDGEVECSADVADDGTVTGSCSGKDVAGTEFGTVLDGTVDVDKATCTGTITVTWGEEALLQDDNYDCIDG